MVTGPTVKGMSWRSPFTIQGGQKIESNHSQFDPAFANQTSEPGTPGYNTSLILDITNSTTTADVPAGNYGLSVPDLGDVYGATASVIAKKDYQEFQFQIDEGMSTEITAIEEFFLFSVVSQGEYTLTKILMSVNEQMRSTTSSHPPRKAGLPVSTSLMATRNRATFSNGASLRRVGMCRTDVQLRM